MKRWLGTALFLILFALYALPSAYNLDCLMRHDTVSMGLNWGMILLSLSINPQVRKLFFLLMGCGVLAAVAVLINTSGVNYKSKMRKITPELTLPKADGQGQYGTAEFLKESEMKGVWSKVSTHALEQELTALLELADQELIEMNSSSKADRKSSNQS